MENANQDMEDFIVEGFAYTDTKIGEGTFTRDMVHGDPGIGTVSPAPVLIPEDIKEMMHILVTVDMTEKVEEKQAWRVITGRAKRGITISH